ncbi:MAG: 4-alpha-glucanotransferase, partial [Chloroflexi bacterium]
MGRRAKPSLASLMETMGPPISSQPWSPQFTAQTLEVLPVGLSSGALFWMKPMHADSLRVGLPPSATPADVVLDVMKWYPLTPVVVHSTSWRHEAGRIILTYGPRARPAPPLVAGARRSCGDGGAVRLEGGPRRVPARAFSRTGLSAERASRWGILPAYHGWQGELARTSPEVEQAILAAMGADSDVPPPQQRPNLPDEPCWHAPERAWGWAIQLYALRSKESWGVGDFADLRRFARFSRGVGASAILLNPLGAQTPTLPYQPSPYYSSTRRFRNVVYLRPEDVEGAERVDLAGERAAARALNAQRLIDYSQVFRLKSQALEKIFRAAPAPNGLATFVKRQGAALHEFASFNVRCEHHGPAWRDWPDAAEEPDAERIAFHEWQQFHVDRQMARASRE